MSHGRSLASLQFHDVVSIGYQGNLEAIRITKEPITSPRFSIKAQRSFPQAFATRGFSATTNVAAVVRPVLQRTAVTLYIYIHVKLYLGSKRSTTGTKNIPK